MKKRLAIIEIGSYNTKTHIYEDENIIYDNNHFRPSYALQYKNPIEYRTQLGFN